MYGEEGRASKKATRAGPERSDVGEVKAVSDTAHGSQYSPGYVVSS